MSANSFNMADSSGAILLMNDGYISCFYIANVNKVTETVSKNIQNGQLAVALSSNADISSVLDKTILDCLTVWGSASAASAFEGITSFSGLI
jgi:hypothetical protein